MTERTKLILSTGGAVASMALACGLLGAFGGCTLQLGRLPDSTPALKLAVVGGVAGLVLGLIVGARRLQSVQSRSPYWGPIAFGMAWTAASILCIYTALSMGARYVTTPVRVAIRLDRAGDLPFSFTADMTATYHVELDLEKEIPSEDLVKILDGSRGSKPEIRWTVTGVRYADRGTQWRYSDYGDTAILALGYFKAVRDRPYMLKVSVVKPSPVIQATNPRFQVQLSRVDRSKKLAVEIMALVGAIFSGFVAFFLLLHGLIMWRKWRRMR